MPSLPTGRRLFAHKEVLARADPATMADIIAQAQKAIAHDKKTLQVELSRRGLSKSRFGPEAVRLDGLLDRSVTGLDLYFDSFLRICDPDDDIALAAAELRNTIFPTGVGDITSLPYIQEDEAVAAILARLAEPDMQALLARLPGAGRLVDQIATRQAQYHAELHKNDDRPSQEDMFEMQQRGNEYIQGTAILILAYHVRTGDDTRANDLLDAIRRQIQDVREARRRRRPPLDVNPETGEPELPGNEEPTPED